MLGRAFPRILFILGVFALFVALLGLARPAEAGARRPTSPVEESSLLRLAAPVIQVTQSYTVFLPISMQAHLSGQLYSDAFANTGSGWLIHGQESARWNYQSGGYEMEVRQPYRWAGARAPFVPPASYGVQAEMQRLGSVPTVYGLVFDQTDWENFTVFGVDPSTQRYALWQVRAGAQVYLVGWTDSAHIKAGEGVNLLRVARDAQQITLFINQMALPPVALQASSGRYVGLYDESGATPSAVARFDNFSVLAGATTAATASPSSAQSCDGSEGVYLYDLPAYQGACVRLTADTPALANLSLPDNAASSLRLVGIWRATLYDQPTYQGDSSSFTQDDPDLGDDLINQNRVSSVRIQSGGTGSTCSPLGRFCGAYYSNLNLSGNPTFTRSEETVAHNWGTGSPGHGVPADGFSVRWTGHFTFTPGIYTFIARTDDGMRVWVDGTLILDQWRDQGSNEYRVRRTLSGGQHEIRVEYYEQVAGAVAEFRWESGCPTGTFQAQYYPNRFLTGTPLFTQNEACIQYDWGTGGPGNGMPTDSFSVRWTGRFNFAAGNYTFIARTDDGMRVWVDGTLLIDQWRDQGVTEYRASLNLSAGEHEIKVEYYDAIGGAVAQLSWQLNAVPGQYLAEYYPNRYLLGEPRFTRTENLIAYDWGTGGAGNGMPTDNFSVRWTGRFSFAAGNYTFIARTDDGMRVWVDGTLLIDQWRDQSVTEYRATRTLSAGEHEVKVEYYEGSESAATYLRWELACPTGQYRGEYYSNRELSGIPARSLCESTINYNWGTSGPGSGIPADNFSARWTGTFSFSAGTYTLVARMDDGMRIWIDGILILDQWQVQNVAEYRVTQTLSAGEHTIRVEYFEGTGNAVAQLRWE